MAGDSETGVTIHRTVSELDAGPIAAQERFPIRPADDAGDVLRRCAEIAVELLDTVLTEPGPVFVPQPEEGVSYAEKITSAERRLDLGRPAADLVRVVRALSPHIGARAELHGRGVTVWAARVGRDGAFEPVEVQPDGGQRMDYGAWLRGLRP
jgi:methionyl-tRNA formyltransferase